MRPLLLIAVLLAGCTCDIHIDSSSAPSVVVKPAAATSKPLYEYTESNITDQATLTRITDHGWEIVDGPVTFRSDRQYHLRRPLTAEKTP